MKISVITATFNRGHVISDSLQSLYSQNYHDFEHIVVDGASTDSTLDVIGSYSDERTFVVSEPDNGVYDAFNKGLARACGDVIGFLHSDDFFASEEVLALVADAFGNGECDLVYGDLDYVSSVDPTKIVRHWRAGGFSRIGLKLGWMPPHPTVFITRELMDRVGPFDCSYRIACDYDFLMKCLAEPSTRVGYIPATLVKMRLGGVSNGSIGRILRKSREDLAIIRSRKIFPGLSPLTLLIKNMRKISQFFVR